VRIAVNGHLGCTTFGPPPLPIPSTRAGRAPAGRPTASRPPPLDRERSGRCGGPEPTEAEVSLEPRQERVVVEAGAVPRAGPHARAGLHGQDVTAAALARRAFIERDDDRCPVIEERRDVV